MLPSLWLVLSLVHRKQCGAVETVLKEMLSSIELNQRKSEGVKDAKSEKIVEQLTAAVEESSSYPETTEVLYYKHFINPVCLKHTQFTRQLKYALRRHAATKIHTAYGGNFLK